MAKLSDIIEEFIKTMLQDGTDAVDLQRNELAQYFGCAPSQINYVLMTRFSLDKGYIIQSQKGGGGYIRIIRVDTGDGYLLNIVNERIGKEISQNDALAVLSGIYSAGILTSREFDMLSAAVTDKAIPAASQVRDYVRACILREILLVLLDDQRREKNDL